MRVPAALTITTLGALAIAIDGCPIGPLASQKAAALLVYLALTGRPHSRESLATLLWDDRTQAQALGNLRVVLSSLRAQVGPYIAITRQRVGIALQADLWIDAVALSAATGAADQPEQLERAVALYRGDFLDGLVLRDCQLFEEWVTIERERLHVVALGALEQLVAHALANCDWRRGHSHAERLLQLDPLNETGHRQLMRLLALSGQASAALAHYDALSRLLLAELDTAPAAETVALATAISGGRNLPSELGATPAAAAHALIAPATPFVDRSTELAQIAVALANPACRLLTLVGPGGIGKTRLALAAVSAHSQLIEKTVCAVDLTAVAAPRLLIHAIAGVLGVSFSGSRDPEAQLLGALQNRQLILLLDNFEHVLERAALLDAILRRAPGITIVVTSRERLSLQAEWVFEVPGMAFLPYDPAYERAADVRYRKPLPSIEALERASAVQLFVQRARRAQPDFVLTKALTPAVLRICALVEGLPLAIELAAGWLRVLTCQQIADDLTRSLDLLATTLRDVPPRHRSMHAVFEQSWRLLSRAEQALLGQLAVFRGGWTLAASQAVCIPDRPGGPAAEASILPLLARLVDCSLVRGVQDGRYQIHELIRQFVEARLQADEWQAEAAEQRHAAYFGGWLTARAVGLRRNEQREVFALVGAEIENLRAAWRRSVQRRDIQAFAELVEGLAIFWNVRGYLQEGHDSCAAALVGLGQLGPPSLIGRLLTWQGHFSERLGDYPAAIGLYEQAIALLHDVGNRSALGFAVGSLGRVTERSGRYAEARRYHQEALAHYTAAEDCWGMAWVQHNLASVAEFLGEYDAALAAAHTALALSRAVGDRRNLADALNMLGIIKEAVGDLGQAQLLYEEVLEHSSAIDDQWGVTMALANLGDVALGLGDLRLAQEHYRRTLQSRHHSWDVPQMLISLWKHARLFRRAGQLEHAVELLALPLLSHETEQTFKIDGAQMLAELEVLLPREVVAGARARGSARTLDETVAWLLHPHNTIAKSR